jgi:hypothetical protein
MTPVEKKIPLHKLVKCSPSSGERFYSCPNSAIVARLSKWDSSIYAATGTGVMAIIEKALAAEDADETFFGHYVGKTEKVDGLDVTYTEEDMDAAIECFEEIQYLREFEEAEVEVEVELNTIIDVGLNKLPIKGRADFVVTTDDSYGVIDYKHGVAHVVNALNNKQMLMYLKALVDTRGPKEHYFLQIIQPRARYDLSKFWEMTHEQFEGAWQHMEAAFARINLAAEYFARHKSLGFPHYEPGDHCKWCTIEASCPALVDKAITAALAGKMTEKGPGEMVEWMIAAAPEVKAALASAEKVGYQRLLDGRKVKGFKLIQASGNRSIRKDLTKEEIQTLKRYGLYTMAPKVAGVGEFEKAGKAHEFDTAPFILPGKQTVKMVTENTPGDPVGTTDAFNDEGAVKETKRKTK